jgi:hypothetical protein
MKKDKKKTWISEDKSQKYIGEFDFDGKKHGEGTYIWEGIGEVTGKFENDQLPSYGKFLQYDEFEYIGEMKNRDGQFNGKGVQINLVTKDKLEGEFKNGALNGYGVLIQNDGSTFKGNWKKSLKHGKGTLVNAFFFRSGEENGEEFIVDGGPLSGEYKDDLPIGEFYWEMTSGRKYIGEINKNGVFHGKGILTHPDGSMEKGIWENGKLVKPN